VDHLLDKLAAALVLLPPPGRMQTVAEVAGQHQAGHAGCPGADQPGDVLHRRPKAELEVNLGDDPGLLSGLHHPPGRIHVQRDRLLDEHMDAAPGSLLYFVGMSIGRQSDIHRIRPGLVEHGDVVIVHRRFPARDLLRQRLRIGPHLIAAGHQTHTWVRG